MTLDEERRELLEDAAALLHEEAERLGEIIERKYREPLGKVERRKSFALWCERYDLLRNREVVERGLRVAAKGA